jgi:N-acetylglucosaminyldiphosphoundecaprenol N-acetyl-beta-D-mannosaminyltransferase
MTAPAVTVLGCRVDILDRAAALERVVALAHASHPSLVVTLGTEMVVHARRDPAFRRLVNGAALSLCDTIGLVLAARLQGVRLPERVTGVELVEALAAISGENDLRLFFLGSASDTAERAARMLVAKYPQARIVGTRNGYFTSDAVPEVISAIAKSGANVVCCGLGSPRQERFLAEALAASGCPVGIGVGGSFDVFAGNVRRAPRAVQRLGLEWLYRLVREPRRWRRQLALPQFAALALAERFAPSSLRRSP